jgi:sugar lactone lactonase YvrE
MPTTLLSGIALGESPRWHDDRLWFADWGAQEIVTVDDAGHRERVSGIASFPFSIDWLPDGRLLVVSSSTRQLLVRESDGSLVPHAELSGLSEKPWNEIVVDGRGNTYLNNIGFDFPHGEVTTGMIALVTPDGSVRQVADDVAFPNGMAVTPDNSTLIVAESYGNRLTAFDMIDDGGLKNRRVWADLGTGVPDGICLDADGAVWYADVPNRRCVRVREGGEVLQTVDADRSCFACMLGGGGSMEAAGRTLFIMAGGWPAAMDPTGPRTGQVLTAQAPAAGVGWP